MSIIQRLFRRYSKETQVQDVLSSDNKPQKKYEPDHCEITNASAGNFDGISQAALDLLKRDQERSAYVRQRTQESPQTPQSQLVNSKTKTILEQEQLVLGQLNDYFCSEIKKLRGQIKTTRSEFKIELKQIDLDNPYRNSMLASYNPERLMDRIKQLQRIYDDPFYAKVVLKAANDSEEREYYIGREQFRLGDIKILSTWSKFGKAFRQNGYTYSIQGKVYSLTHRYTFIMQDHKITGVKDESPE